MPEKCERKEKSRNEHRVRFGDRNAVRFMHVTAGLDTVVRENKAGTRGAWWSGIDVPIRLGRSSHDKFSTMLPAISAAGHRRKVDAHCKPPAWFTRMLADKSTSTIGVGGGGGGGGWTGGGRWLAEGTREELMGTNRRSGYSLEPC